ncbi:hypothetical protein QCA50_010740 [Cerrena zonata]|uniref:Uncharacterized protein n=1 Tax=Cerrena zonata TaxID=2478898 RepID=A0AAW0FYR7_9APHY
MLLPFVKRAVVYFAREHVIHKLPIETKSHILHFCDLPTLLGLYCDNGWRELVGIEMMLCYNALLASFTPNPASFRQMMSDTGSIISGSTALYLLLRQPCTWKPRDVDVIGVNEGYKTLLAFILSLPGAKVVSDSREQLEGDGPDSYPYEGLRRLVKVSTDMANFDVIESTGSVPSNTVVHYWGTHVMNALTADSIQCAYPALTLAHKVIQVRYTNATNPITKYKQRGFELIRKEFRAVNLSASCGHNVLCSSRDRYFGDEDTLVLPIPGLVATGRERQMGSGGPRRVSAWRMGGRACGTADCCLALAPRVEEIIVVPVRGEGAHVSRNDVTYEGLI